MLTNSSIVRSTSFPEQDNLCGVESHWNSALPEVPGTDLAKSNLPSTNWEQEMGVPFLPGMPLAYGTGFGATDDGYMANLNSVCVPSMGMVVLVKAYGFHNMLNFSTCEIVTS